MKRKSTIPDDPLDQLVPREIPAAMPAVRRPLSRNAEWHKLTTYLTAEQYRWALQASSAAKQEGHPLSIADVVRAAVDHLRSIPDNEVRRMLGLTDTTELS